MVMDNFKNSIQNISLRKTIKTVVFIILIIVFVFVVFYIFTHGKINVATNSKLDKVTIYKIGKSDKGNTVVYEGLGGVSKIISKGEYFVKISNGLYATTKPVHVSAFKISNVSTSLNKTSTVEYVINDSASSIASNSSRLIYLDTNNQIKFIDSTNLDTLLSSNIFTKARWINAEKGIAKSENNFLYEITGKNLKPINLPSEITNSVYDYSVSKNGNLYIWNENNVYLQKNNALSKIYSVDAGEKINKVIAENEKTIITTREQNSIKLEKESKVVVLDSNKKLLSKEGVELYEIAISPSGKYIAITNDNSSTILDTVSLQQVAKLPDANVISIIWLDDNRIAYGVQDNLVEYAIDDNSSQVLTASLDGEPISYLSKDDSGKYLYIQTPHKDSNSYYIQRVNITNSKETSLKDDLTGLFPKIVNGCTFNLVNFSKPTIHITTNIKGAENSCIQEVKKYLTNNSINQSLLVFNSRYIERSINDD